MYPCVSSVRENAYKCKRVCVRVQEAVSVCMYVPAIPSRWVCHDFPDLKLAVENYILNDFDITRCVLHVHASTWQTSRALEFEAEMLNSRRCCNLSYSFSSCTVLNGVYIRTYLYIYILLLLAVICWCFTVLSCLPTLHLLSYDSMKQLCDRYNKAITNIRRLVCGVHAHTHQGPCTCVNEAFWYCLAVGIKCIVLKCVTYWECTYSVWVC